MSTTDTTVDGAVVAGFDGSAEARRAVYWAAAEARRRQRALLIVHAFQWRAETVPHAWVPSGQLGEKTLREHTGADLANLAEDVRRDAPDLSVLTVLRDGLPAVTLGEVADEADAGLVVIGSTGQGALSRMLLGSTAAELIRATDRPLVVVRGEPEAERIPSPVDDMPDAPVLVGVDGSQANQPAIEFAFEFAARHDCAVHAVHAWYDVPLDVVNSARMSNADRNRTQVAATEAAEQHLADWTRRYPQVPVQIECVTDRPAQALLERADNARLLVVGSHGHGVLRRTLLGSVSHAALYHASCPVGVVRATNETE